MRAILLLITLILFTLPIQAYNFESNGVYYNFIPDTDEVEVTYFIEYRHDDFDGEGDYYEDIVIPEVVTYEEKTYRVTSIGYEAFRESGIESVTIPSSVEKFGFWSFSTCSCLKKIEVQWKTPFDVEKMEKQENNSDFESCYIYIFDGTDISKLSLVVPKGTKKLYEKAHLWKDFGTISEKSE